MTNLKEHMTSIHDEYYKEIYDTSKSSHTIFIQSKVECFFYRNLKECTNYRNKEKDNALIAFSSLCGIFSALEELSQKGIIVNPTLLSPSTMQSFINSGIGICERQRKDLLSTPEFNRALRIYDQLDDESEQYNPDNISAKDVSDAGKKLVEIISL